MSEAAHALGLLILADGPAGPAYAQTARDAGVRVLATASVAEASDAIDRAAAIGAVLLDTGEHTPALAAALDRIEAEAAWLPSLVCTTPALLDQVWEAAPSALLLVEPGEAELAQAMRDALRSGVAPALAEHRPPAQLRHLSEEVGRIARTLAALSEGETAYTPPPSVGSASQVAPPPSAAAIRAMLRARRLRGRYFDPALFADPVWDMLLDLMAARLEVRPVAVSSLCIAAAVPTSTALRWIRVMTEAGLITRVADPADGRRHFLALTDATANALAAYFAELGRQDLPGA